MTTVGTTTDADYLAMPYFTLKAACKKQGLPSNGKRPALLKRLGVNQETEKVPEPEVKAPIPTFAEAVPIPNAELKAKPPEKKAILAATPEDLNRFLPDVKNIAPIDTGKYQPWLTNERLEKLSNRISPISAGKGKFKFQINHDKAAFQVEFSGKGPLLESTTLIDTDDQIVRRAEVYFNSRLIMGRNNQQSAI